MTPTKDSPHGVALARIETAKATGDTDLNLAHLGLTSLPPEVCALRSLRSLNLRFNALTSLPEGLSALTRLETLALQGNHLTTTPSLAGMQELRFLDIDDNEFSDLPDGTVTLSDLRTLYCTNNRLTELPREIGRLQRLERLGASGNLITTLPRELAELRELTMLQLDRNPLRDPFPALVVAGIEALGSYLRSLDDAQPQYEAKLLLVGEGEVGKSSLIAALKDLPFLEGRDSTHGIELTPLELDHPELSLKMLLNAWDFGGQEVYRTTHQFFFTRRAIYLVVWKPRQGQVENAIDDWCRRIRLRVGDEAKIIVVATHSGERAPELDYPLLQATFGDVLVGNHAVDNDGGNGIPALRREIARQAAELPHMGERISAAWQAARRELLALPEAQIAYARFCAICAAHGLDAGASRALCRMLHNLGLIIHYDEDDGLRDIVVLQPEWLTKAISHVLEDMTTRAASGVLDHHRLPEVWRADKVGGYSAQEHPYFLRLMEKFDVSFRIPETQQSLVGQLVPYERPAIPWRTGAATRRLSLRWVLSEPVEGLVSWLTVRNHRFSVGVHWRRGVFVEHTGWGAQALLELIEDGQLELTVAGPSPDGFFSVLRDGIEYLIAQRWEGLSYELLVPCRGELDDGSPCPDSFKFRHLLRDREDGETQARCPECRTRFDVGELLTGFTPAGATLHSELQELRESVDRVKGGVDEIKALASQSANQIRIVLKAVSAEVDSCPGLFTLVPVAKRRAKALRVWNSLSRLTLWCEHADHEHPWPPASYEITATKTWAAELAPYAALVVKTLQVAAPIAVAGLGVGMSEKEFKAVKAELDLMKAVIAELPSLTPTSDLTDDNGRLTQAEGAGLRALRALLAREDPSSAFGGMRRRLTPAGDYVWICPQHIQEYDPGLPVLPRGG